MCRSNTDLWSADLRVNKRAREKFACHPTKYRKKFFERRKEGKKFERNYKKKNGG